MSAARADLPFRAAVALVLALATLQLAGTLQRLEGLVLADEAEYLIMAESLREELSSPVLPKRPWGLPLLQAPLLRMAGEDPGELVEPGLPAESGQAADPGQATAPGQAFDPGPARAVSVLGLALTALAAAALAGRAAGRWAGLAAFALVALQPELAFWSGTFMTDVPFAATAVLAVVLWVRGRPFGAGLALGAGLLLRTPAVLFVGAFGLVALAQRRWRAAGRLGLGLVPPLVLLGLSDALLWGAPFQSVLSFVQDQAAVFLPEWLLPASQVAAEELELVLSGPREWYERPAWWYLGELPALLTWPVLALVLAWPLARRGFERRGEIDFALWVALTYLVTLSALRAKETRYLVAALPLCAAAAGVVCARLPGLARRVRAAPALGAAVAVSALAASAALGWRALEARPHRPHGAVLDALPADPAAARVVAVDSQWKLLSRVQVRGYWSSAWIGAGRTVVNAPELFRDLATDPAGETFARAHEVLGEVDLWVLPRSWNYRDNYELWRWLDRTCEVEQLVYDPGEHDYPVLSFRPAGSGASHCLWKTGPLGDAASEERYVLARFEGGLELHAVELGWSGSDPERARVDLHWNVPADLEGGALVRLRVERPAAAPADALLASDVFQLVPLEGPARADRLGVALRESRYLRLPREAALPRVVLELFPDSWGGERAVEWTRLEQLDDNTVALVPARAGDEPAGGG